MYVHISGVVDSRCDCAVVSLASHIRGERKSGLYKHFYVAWIPKITLRFPHLYISSYICASTLITCAIITLHRLLPCDLTLIVDFANLDGCFV